MSTDPAMLSGGRQGQHERHSNENYAREVNGTVLAGGSATTTEVRNSDQAARAVPPAGTCAQTTPPVSTAAPLIRLRRQDGVGQRGNFRPDDVRQHLPREGVVRISSAPSWQGPRSARRSEPTRLVSSRGDGLPVELRHQGRCCAQSVEQNCEFSEEAYPPRGKNRGRRIGLARAVAWRAVIGTTAWRLLPIGMGARTFSTRRSQGLGRWHACADGQDAAVPPEH